MILFLILPSLFVNCCFMNGVHIRSIFRTLRLHLHESRQRTDNSVWTAWEKQTVRQNGRMTKQNMEICCHGDVVLFTKNYFVFIISCNFSSTVQCLSRVFFPCVRELCDIWWEIPVWRMAKSYFNFGWLCCVLLPPSPNFTVLLISMNMISCLNPCERSTAFEFGS